MTGSCEGERRAVRSRRDAPSETGQAARALIVASTGRSCHHHFPVHERMHVAPQEVGPRRRRSESIGDAIRPGDHRSPKDRVLFGSLPRVDADVVVHTDVQVREEDLDVAAGDGELFGVERIVPGDDLDPFLDPARRPVQCVVERGDRVSQCRGQAGEEERERQSQVQREKAEEGAVQPLGRSLSRLSAAVRRQPLREQPRRQDQQEDQGEYLVAQPDERERPEDPKEPRQDAAESFAHARIMGPHLVAGKCGWPQGRDAVRTSGGAATT